MLAIHSYLTRLLLCLLLLPCTIFAQSDLQFSGRVIDQDGAAIEGVTVFIHEANAVRITDEQGKFSFQNLKPGAYHLHLNLVGFVADHKDIRVASGQEPVTYTLVRSHVELRQAIVEESMFKSAANQSSQSVSMVDRDFLMKNGQFSLVKMLEAVPGVSSINTGTGVSKPVIRGMSFNRVVVAENGIKQEGQQWGGDHGLEIDQFAVERVEIIKGPSSLMYGSDGLGGVVNIRPAPFPKKNTVSGSALLTGRTVNDFIGSSFMAAINHNERFLRIRFSSQDYGDYRVPAESFNYNSYILPIVNKRLKNTSGQERNFQLMTGINRSWGFTTLTASRYSLDVGMFSGAHGIPNSYELQDDGDSRNIDLPKQRVEHYKLLSNTAILLGKNWLDIDLGYQINHRSEFSFPHAHGKGPQPQGNKELEFKLQTLSGNTRYHFEFSERLKWVAGVSGQAQRNTIDGFQFLIPEFTTFSTGAFIFNKYSILKSLTLNAGLRYDFGNIQTQQYLAPIYSDSVTISNYTERSPQLDRNFNNFSGGAGLSWFPSDHWNFKLNLGKSFRMPATPELTSNGVHHGSFRHEMGDANLTSEHGYQSDISISFENGHRLIRLTPFFNFFNKYIFLDPTSSFSTLPEAGLIYRFNQADAIHTGLELQSDFHLTDAFHAGLSGQYVYAYNLETSYVLPFIPPAQLKLDLSYEWEKIAKKLDALNLGIQVQAVADQYETARNELPTKGFTLLNLNASSTIKFGNQEVRIVLSLQNAFNTRYFAHLNRYRILNLPEPGRNVLLTLYLPFERNLTKRKTS
jgi:iron complex outermembrane receptor protein